MSSQHREERERSEDIAADESSGKPPSPDLAERLFQWCACYMGLIGFIIGILRWVVDKRTIESDGGPIGAAAGILFGLCFFYVINYLVWRVVTNRFVQVAWWSLMALLALLIASLWLSPKRHPDTATLPHQEKSMRRSAP